MLVDTSKVIARLTAIPYPPDDTHLMFHADHEDVPPTLGGQVLVEFAGPDGHAEYTVSAYDRLAPIAGTDDGKWAVSRTFLRELRHQEKNRGVWWPSRPGCYAPPAMSDDYLDRPRELLVAMPLVLREYRPGQGEVLLEVIDHLVAPKADWPNDRSDGNFYIAPRRW